MKTGGNEGHGHEKCRRRQSHTTERGGNEGHVPEKCRRRQVSHTTERGGNEGHGPEKCRRRQLSHTTEIQTHGPTLDCVISVSNMEHPGEHLT
jgi:hypothetical protein